MGKIYLAARYSRREELCGYREQLRGLGHTVTSRWLNGNHQVDDQGLSVEAAREERERFAREDHEDVMAADWHINFTEPPRASNSRGGRHVELGLAIAAGQHVWIVGPRENVFHCLPKVRVFDTWDEAWRQAIRQRTGYIPSPEAQARFEERRRNDGLPI